MATSTRTIRAPDATWALLDARAEKDGVSANALAASLLQAALADPAAEEPPARIAPRKAPASKPTPAPAAVPGVVKASDLAKVETGGASMRLAMDRAGIAQYDPAAKRPQYVKGQGKAKGR